MLSTLFLSPSIALATRRFQKLVAPRLLPVRSTSDLTPMRVYAACVYGPSNTSRPSSTAPVLSLLSAAQHLEEVRLPDPVVQ